MDFFYLTHPNEDQQNETTTSGTEIEKKKLVADLSDDDLRQLKENMIEAEAAGRQGRR